MCGTTVHIGRLNSCGKNCKWVNAFTEPRQCTNLLTQYVYNSQTCSSLADII